MSTYTCANCKGTFETGWSDEEALAESRERFGDVPKEELGIVCDSCFKEMEAAGLLRLSTFKAGES